MASLALEQVSAVTSYFVTRLLSTVILKFSQLLFNARYLIFAFRAISCQCMLRTRYLSDMLIF